MTDIQRRVRRSGDKPIHNHRQPLINGHPPQTGNDCAVYAIGDIHGRLDLLTALYRLIEQDVAGRAVRHRHLIHLGDYVDRGPQSMEVIDRFCRQPLTGFNNHWLLGNHEDDLLAFLATPVEATRWLSNGGWQTLRSYGIRPDPAATPDSLAAAFAERLPSAHRKFLTSLPVSWSNGDYLFVHAGLRPGVAPGQQTVQDRIWIRQPFLSSDREFGQIIVHGHTPRHQPEVRGNRIGIDTGAFATGCLTCVVLHGTKIEFLQTGGNGNGFVRGRQE